MTAPTPIQRIRAIRRSAARLAGTAALLCLAGLHSASAAAQSFDLDTLMHALAQHRSGQAHFSETKTLALLDKPIVSSGELSFRAPDHFEKRTLLPTPELLTVDGDTLTIERNGKQHVLALTQYPEIAAALDGVRGTLSGERATLERSYTVTLEGDAAHWRLLLAPTNARAAKQIARITLVGTTGADGAAALNTVRIEQANHDTTVTTIVPVPAP